MRSDLKQRLTKLAFVTPGMDPQSAAPDPQTMMAQQALGIPPTDPTTGQPLPPPPQIDPATGQPIPPPPPPPDAIACSVADPNTQQGVECALKGLAPQQEAGPAKMAALRAAMDDWTRSKGTTKQALELGPAPMIGLMPHLGIKKKPPFGDLNHVFPPQPAAAAPPGPMGPPDLANQTTGPPDMLKPLAGPPDLAKQLNGPPAPVTPGSSPFEAISRGVGNLRQGLGNIGRRAVQEVQELPYRFADVNEAAAQGKRNLEQYDAMAGGPWIPGGLALGGAGIGALLGGRKRRGFGALVGGSLGLGAGILGQHLLSQYARPGVIRNNLGDIANAWTGKSGSFVKRGLFGRSVCTPNPLTATAYLTKLAHSTHLLGGPLAGPAAQLAAMPSRSQQMMAQYPNLMAPRTPQARPPVMMPHASMSLAGRGLPQGGPLGSHSGLAALKGPTSPTGLMGGNTMAVTKAAEDNAPGDVWRQLWNKLPVPPRSEPFELSPQQMVGGGAVAGMGSGMGLGSMGALYGGLGGGLIGLGRGNAPEGIGRGIIRGGMTGAGLGLGSGLGAGLGGALGQQFGDTGLGAGLGGLAGAGLGGLGGWRLAGGMMGEPVGAGKKRVKHGAAPDEGESMGNLSVPPEAGDVAMPPQDDAAQDQPASSGEGSKPPGPEEVKLRQASSAAVSCGACGNFDGQGCQLLQMPVQATQTCDAFSPSPGMAGIDTEAITDAGMSPAPVFKSAAPKPLHRELTPEEEEDVTTSQQNILPTIFQGYGTPLPEMMSSPKWSGIGGAGALGLMGGGMGAALGHGDPWAMGLGALGGAGLGGLIGYHGRKAQNAGLVDLMKRMPPGATMRDYRADPAVSGDLNRSTWAGMGHDVGMALAREKYGAWIRKAAGIHPSPIGGRVYEKRAEPGYYTPKHMVGSRTLPPGRSLSTPVSPGAQADVTRNLENNARMRAQAPKPAAAAPATSYNAQMQRPDSPGMIQMSGGRPYVPAHVRPGAGSFMGSPIDPAITPRGIAASSYGVGGRPLAPNPNIASAARARAEAAVPLQPFQPYTGRRAKPAAPVARATPPAAITPPARVTPPVPPVPPAKVTPPAPPPAPGPFGTIPDAARTAFAPRPGFTAALPRRTFADVPLPDNVLAPRPGFTAPLPGEALAPRPGFTADLPRETLAPRPGFTAPLPAGLFGPSPPPPPVPDPSTGEPPPPPRPGSMASRGPESPPDMGAGLHQRPELPAAMVDRLQQGLAANRLKRPRPTDTPSMMPRLAIMDEIDRQRKQHEAELLAAPPPPNPMFEDWLKQHRQQEPAMQLANKEGMFREKQAAGVLGAIGTGIKGLFQQAPGAIKGLGRKIVPAFEGGIEGKPNFLGRTPRFTAWEQGMAGLKKERGALRSQLDEAQRTGAIHSPDIQNDLNSTVESIAREQKLRPSIAGQQTRRALGMAGAGAAGGAVALSVPTAMEALANRRAAQNAKPIPASPPSVVQKRESGRSATPVTSPVAPAGGATGGVPAGAMADTSTVAAVGGPAAATTPVNTYPDPYPAAVGVMGGPMAAGIPSLGEQSKETPLIRPKQSWWDQISEMGQGLGQHLERYKWPYGIGAGALGLGALAMANQDEDEEDPRRRRERLRRQRLAAMVEEEATGKEAMFKTADLSIGIPTATMLGAPIGAYRAPKGSRWEGAGRGAVAGTGVTIGSGLGALGGGSAGALLGGLGGYGLGSLAGAGSAGGLGGAALGGVLGGTLGTVGGGFAGYDLANQALGPPSWEHKHKHKHEHHEKKGFGLESPTVGTLPLMMGTSLGGTAIGGPLGALMAPEGHRLEGARRGAVNGLTTGMMGGLFGNNIGLGGQMIGDIAGGPYGAHTGSGVGIGAGGVLGGLAGYGIGEKLQGRPSWESHPHEHHEDHEKEGHYPGCGKSRKHQAKQQQRKQRRTRRKRASVELVPLLMNIVKQAAAIKCGCGCSTCAKCGSGPTQKVRVINGPQVRTNKGHFAWRGRNAKSVSDDPSYERFGTKVGSLGYRAATLALSLPAPA